ncbi:hypothetical protein V6N13_075270 [Hibiscus sabdariffa]
MAFVKLVAVGVLWLAMVVGAEYVRYKDPKQPVAVRVKDLMSRMTLAEKIGQMTQIDRSVATEQILRDYSIGSVLSGGGSEPLPEARAEDWINMVNAFQNGSLDPELVKKIGAATALEARATGIPYVFAPCIAVCRDPRWGRCYESYSEDHKVVELMTDIILGLQGDLPSSLRRGVPYVGGKDKVAACAKHFIGDGGTTRGINENNTVIDMHGLLSTYMPAYAQSIIKGVSTVMVSYSSWNGQKMHANRELISGFLKNTLKFKYYTPIAILGMFLLTRVVSMDFQGFVISDWQGIDKITLPPHSNYSYSVQAAIQAGIDMVMVPYNLTEFVSDLTDLVNSKVIPVDRIDDAVQRILLVKFTMGLFENPMADFSLVPELGSQAHRDMAREAVRKSLVLLKNGKPGSTPLLPLPKKASKILVAGTHADNLGYQCGGWTINWQGFDGNNATRGTTILGAVKSTVDPSTEVVYLESPDANFVKSNKLDYAIVVVGEPPYAETAGDSTILTMIDPGPSVINDVCGNVVCVVVIISGRPIVIEPYVSVIDAIVAAWLPGTEGLGVTDVLYGDYGFSGKLPRTWFKNEDQLPMNVGDSHYDPLFPFGFGLKTDSGTSIVSRSTSSSVASIKPCWFILMITITLSFYITDDCSRGGRILLDRRPDWFRHCSTFYDLAAVSNVMVVASFSHSQW